MINTINDYSMIRLTAPTNQSVYDKIFKANILDQEELDLLKHALNISDRNLSYIDMGGCNYCDFG